MSWADAVVTTTRVCSDGNSNKPTFVAIQLQGGVNAAGNGASRLDLGHHRITARQTAVLRHHQPVVRLQHGTETMSMHSMHTLAL